MDKTIRYIIDKALENEMLSKEELIQLLKIEEGSEESAMMRYASRKISMRRLDGKAEIHGQIGLDASPCPIDCKFCSFAPSNHVFETASKLSVDDIIADVNEMEREGANAVYLMTTANYKFDHFIDVVKAVKAAQITDATLVANIPDFSETNAVRLKDAGIDAVYHAIRMGEGDTTGVQIARRQKTIRGAKEAGLAVGMCIEPIGPEHTVEEIAEKTEIARDLGVNYAGSMRRTYIPGSNFPAEEVTYWRMADIVAAINLYLGDQVKGLTSHEPNALAMDVGADLFFGEIGTNPRDTSEETLRGWSIERVADLFRESGYEILEGRSKILEL
ncbi:MAG: radical SAM protein [Peptoniphilus sp.]|nr:radical SAM protein [Peptoniphilus sp.]MDD7363592.1 radical SAM protein [Bacillota bacterium]MDY6045217.1 radical SAM protein [Peptoniphilus sp.]